jgi:hypothetical protein
MAVTGQFPLTLDTGAPSLPPLSLCPEAFGGRAQLLFPKVEHPCRS